MARTVYPGNKPNTIGSVSTVRVILSLLILSLLLFSPITEHLDSSGLKWLTVLFFAWSVGSLLTPLAIRLSFLSGWLDIPSGRKSHIRPTPLLGGLAIIGSFGLALLVNSEFSLQMKGVGLGGLLIWFIGVIDDRHELPASLKLLGQLAAVAILVYTGVHVTFLPNTWWGFSLEIVITAIWVVGITNAVNFLDGMDGLATGMSTIIALFIAIVAVQSGQTYFAYVAIALLGSCIAFLPYNFHRRRNAAIFLGDNGATFLGFTLAATAVMGNWAQDNLATLIVPILLFGVPIFDMVLTTVMRIRNGHVKSVGQWLAYAGRDHFHHRLTALGIGRYLAVIIIWFVVAILGISAIALKQARGLDAMLLLLQMSMIFGMICFFMIYVRSSQIKLFIEAQEGSEMGGNNSHLELENSDRHPGTTNNRETAE